MLSLCFWLNTEGRLRRYLPTGFFYPICLGIGLDFLSKKAIFRRLEQNKFICMYRPSITIQACTLKSLLNVVISRLFFPAHFRAGWPACKKVDGTGPKWTSDTACAKKDYGKQRIILIAP